MFSFNNVERIEVLKGPQGTLFGRNATGGVIQIITRDPSQTPEFDADIGYGNYGTVTTSLYGSGALTPTLAIAAALQYQDQSEGWGKNILLGTDTYTSKEFSTRGKAVWKPRQGTKVTLGWDYENLSNGFPEYQIAPPSAGLTGLPSLPGRYDTEDNFKTPNKVYQWGLSPRLEQDLGLADLVSISARRQNSGNFGPYDSDGTPVNFVQATLRGINSQWSQEVQLIAPKTSLIDWLVGAYFFDDQAGYSPARLAGSHCAAAADL